MEIEFEKHTSAHSAITPHTCLQKHGASDCDSDRGQGGNHRRARESSRILLRAAGAVRARAINSDILGGKARVASSLRARASQARALAGTILHVLLGLLGHLRQELGVDVPARSLLRALG